MNDSDARTHQMLVRSREFFAQNVNDFSVGGAALQFFAGLQTSVTKVEQQAGAHASSIGQARHGTRTKADTREDLRGKIEDIYSVARSMGVESRFPRPAINNDEELLQAADAYTTNALPFKADFIAHELPASFLEDLAASKTAFQAAIVEQANAVGDHIGARKELDDALDEGVQFVRKLNGIIKVVYADNPGKLAEWLAASHIERAPQRAKPVAPPPPTSPTPRSSPPS